MSSQIARCDAQDKEIVEALKDRISTLERERDEAYRRRDEWKKKAEGYDAVRLALREKVGFPWPPSLSQTLWAGIAADEKKRADDARCEAFADAVQAIRKAGQNSPYMTDRTPSYVRGLEDGYEAAAQAVEHLSQSERNP